MSLSLHFLYVFVIGATGVVAFNAKGYDYLGIALMTLAGLLFCWWLFRLLEEFS